MKYTKRVIFTLSLFLVTSHAFSQNNVKLSLKDAILHVHKNSLDYRIAVNLVQSSYWNYQAFQLGLRPKLSLTGTLPDYYRTINMITLPNGQNSFVSQNVANSGLNLNLSHNISLTGGSLSMGSSLRRINNFGTLKNTVYTSIPFTLSYFQNNLFYNYFKWQRKIEPLKLEEAQRGYLENVENISYKTIDKYFELLKAEIQLKLDYQNLTNIDTLVKITQARFEIGTVQLNDVLQAKISLLNAKKAVSTSKLALQTAKQNFTRFLNIDKDQQIELEIPDSTLFFNINADFALNQAMENRKLIVESKRRRIEAEQEIAETKSQTGPSLNIRANLGLTQSGSTLNQTYDNLIRNQSIIVGFHVPLIDWGINKSNRKRAEANLELEKNVIAQQELSMEQEVYYQIIKWNMQKEQLEIGKETRNLAQQRYDIARQKYALGSLSYTDFNNAQLEKDRAVTDYMNNLQDYWSCYYLVRKLTLFDFEQNTKLTLQDVALNLQR